MQMKKKKADSNSNKWKSSRVGVLFQIDCQNLLCFASLKQAEKNHEEDLLFVPCNLTIYHTEIRKACLNYVYTRFF